MAHKEQQDFVNRIKNRFPEMFCNKKVLEIGSYILNGTVRNFFTECQYIGIDVCQGPGVDVVCSGHEYKDDSGFDVIISCEAMEHNPHWSATISNSILMLRKTGLFIMTCGTTGRGVHGTLSTTPVNSPSHVLFGEYYGNLTESDIEKVIDLNKEFLMYGFETNTLTCDLYMWGIKK